MTKKDLKVLRGKLPHGSKYKLINEKLEKSVERTYSDGTIQQVLLGKRNNDNIILAAIEVANEHQKKLTEGISSLKE